MVWNEAFTSECVVFVAEEQVSPPTGLNPSLICTSIYALLRIDGLAGTKLLASRLPFRIFSLKTERNVMWDEAFTSECVVFVAEE